MTRCKFRAIATAIAVICVAGLVTSSRAQNVMAGDKVPELDMHPTCQGAANLNLDLKDEPTVQSCIDEEEAARHTLEGVWSTSSGKRRRDCTTATQTGGPPSYVDLLWCLQDAQARKL